MKDILIGFSGAIVAFVIFLFTQYKMNINLRKSINYNISIINFNFLDICTNLIYFYSGITTNTCNMLQDYEKAINFLCEELSLEYTNIMNMNNFYLHITTINKMIKKYENNSYMLNFIKILIRSLLEEIFTKEIFNKIVNYIDFEIADNSCFKENYRIIFQKLNKDKKLKAPIVISFNKNVYNFNFNYELSKKINKYSNNLIVRNLFKKDYRPDAHLKFMRLCTMYFMNAIDTKLSIEKFKKDSVYWIRKTANILYNVRWGNCNNTNISLKLRDYIPEDEIENILRITQTCEYGQDIVIDRFMGCIALLLIDYDGVKTIINKLFLSELGTIDGFGEFVRELYYIIY